jgi:hypothetical protein
MGEVLTIRKLANKIIIIIMIFLFPIIMVLKTGPDRPVQPGTGA